MNLKDTIKCVHTGLGYSGRSENPNDEILLGELEKRQHMGKASEQIKG